MFRLALASIVPWLRTNFRVVTDQLYAAWWWSIVALLGIIAWPLILLLPGRERRWQTFRCLARIGLKLMGNPVTVDGADRLRNLGGILVTNHASYLDGLVLASILPGTPAFVAKHELSTQLIAGPFLRRLGIYFTERIERQSGPKELENLVDLIHSGEQLVFFPEGTLTRMPGLLEFRLGAFLAAVEARVTVTPITIRGSRSILRGGQWLPRRGKLSIHIGEAIAPQGQAFKAAISLRDAARAVILSHCGEPDLAHERMIITGEGWEKVTV